LIGSPGGNRDQVTLYAQRLDYIPGAVRDPNRGKVHAVCTAAGLYSRNSERPKQRHAAVPSVLMYIARGRKTTTEQSVGEKFNEAIFAYLEVLSQYTPGAFEEKHKEPLSRQTMSPPRFELATPRMITQLQERAMCAINGNGPLDSNAHSDLHVD
jgi:hypothetical protein